MMPINDINDWEKRLDRIDAFWECAIIDRPVARIVIPRPNPAYPIPQKQFASHRERWMDFEFTAQTQLAYVKNNDYLGDALPAVFPNLGPEVFSAFFGCELEYGEVTAWSIPNLEDYAEAGKLQFSEDNFYYKKVNELTDMLLEVGRGHFYTGYTDLHPGGDAIVAFRDPQRMNLDVLMQPEAIKDLIARITPVYFKVFDFYCDKLERAGQPISSWPGYCSRKRYGIPSNDFSCMISREMFDEIFLPGIAEECRHMPANVYHLDGPGALRHLDSLLEIKELQAIQWVFGAGNGRASDWLDIYKKCQAAGKALEINLYPDEIDTLMEHLRPEGVNLGVYGVSTREEAESVLKKIEKWR